jgi:TP901 family phage tail tape measure protein
MADFEKVYSISFSPQTAINDIEKIEKKYKSFVKLIKKSLSSRATSGSITGFTKRLDTISKSLNSVGKTAEKNSKRIKDGFRGAKRASSSFHKAAANKNTEESLKSLSTVLNKIDKEATKVGKKVAKFLGVQSKKPIDKTTKSLKELGKTGSAAFSRIGKSARSTSGNIHGVASAANGAKRSIAGLITKITVFIGAAQGIRSIVSNFLDFDRSMTLAGAKFSSISEDMAPGTSAFKEFRKEIRAAAVDTEHTSASVAGAVDFWAKAGKTAAQTQAVIPVTLDFASANTDASGAALEMAMAGDILSDTLGQFQLDSADPTVLMANTARVSDVMSAAANSANVSAEELFESFKTAGPVLTSVGGSIEETSALLASMANAGLKGSIAGRSLKIAVAALNAPSEKQSKLMDEFGIKVKDTEGNMNSLTNVIGQLDKATSELGTGERFEVFATLLGREGVTGFLNLVAKGEANIGALTEKLRNASGETKRLADITRTSASAQMQKFWNQLSNIGFTIIEETQLFEKLGKVLGDIDWGAVSKVITKKFIPSLMSVVKTFSKFVVPVLGVFSEAVSSVLLPAMELVTFVFGAASKQGEGFSETLDNIISKASSITAEGIIRLKTEFASFILLVSRFANNAFNLFSGIANGIIINWDRVRESFLGTSDAISESYGSLFADLRELLYEIVSIFIGGSSDIETDWTEMGTRIGAAVSGLAIIISDSLSVIATISSAVFGSALKTITTVISGIKSVFSDAFSGILQILEGNFLDGVKRIGAALFNAITLPVRSALTGLIRLIQGIPGADDLAASLGINLDEVSEFIKGGIEVGGFDKMESGALRETKRKEFTGPDVGTIQGVELGVGSTKDATGIDVPDILANQSVNKELQLELAKLNQNVEAVKSTNIDIPEPGVVNIPGVGETLKSSVDPNTAILVEGQKEQLQLQSMMSANSEAFQKQMIELQKTGQATKQAPQIDVKVGPTNLTINAPGVDAEEVARIFRQQKANYDRRTAAEIRNAASSVLVGGL